MTEAASDFLSLQYVKPFVLEDGAARSLHFTRGELQSRMLKRRPWYLDVDYTRTMMGFLLFHPAPAHIGMIGLGGGSLAKFCHRQLAHTRMTVLEINPHVIALRREFQVPDDDERFQVIAADGAAFVQTCAPGFDVLLVDGFDHDGQPAALCSARFYDDCLAALSPTACWWSTCMPTTPTTRCWQDASAAASAAMPSKCRPLKKATASCLRRRVARFRRAG